MLGLALFFVLTAGLGLLLPALQLNGRVSLGAAWLGGYALLTGGVFFAHVAARIPITILLWALLVIAVLGGAKALARGEPHWRTMAAHPCVVLCVFAALVILANGGIGYLPYTVDEFTNWIGTSRLIYLSGGYEAVRDSIYLAGYTPGWRMILTVPWFITGTFDPGQSAAAALVLHAGIAGLFFDAVRYALDTRFPELHKRADIFAWLALLLYLAAQASGALWPYTLLIEQPQIYAYTAILMLLFLMDTAREQSRAIGIYLALALLLAYLLKAAAILFLPGVALALFIVFRRNAHSSAGAIKATALVLAPVLLATVIWGALRPASDSCFSSPGVTLSEAALTQASTYDWADLAQRLAAAVGAYLGSYKWPLSILSALGIVLAAASGRVAMPLALGGFAFLYYAAIYWFHLTCFGPYYFETLASIERFTRVVLQPAHAAGLLALVFMASRLVPKRPFESLVQHKAVFAAAALSCALLFVWQSMVLQRHVDDMTTRRHQNIDTRIVEVARAARFVETQKAYAATPPRIQFISQGTDRDILGYATYYQLGERNGAPVTLFTFDAAVSWALGSPENPWQQSTSRESLTARFRKADIIWPIFTAPWIDAVLNDLAGGPPCPQPLGTAILVRRDDGGYDCRAKP